MGPLSRHGCSCAELGPFVRTPHGNVWRHACVAHQAPWHRTGREIQGTNAQWPRMHAQSCPDGRGDWANPPQAIVAPYDMKRDSLGAITERQTQNRNTRSGVRYRRRVVVRLLAEFAIPARVPPVPRYRPSRTRRRAAEEPKVEMTAPIRPSSPQTRLSKCKGYGYGRGWRRT